MVDAAHEATERKLAQMERHLRGIYSRALKEVGSGWTEYLEASAPEAARRQAAIRNATTEEAKRKAEKAYQDFLKEQTVYEARFHRLTNQLATELCHVNQTAQAYINDQLPGIYATNYNIVGTAVGQPVVWGVWELVDADTVKRLATTDETLLPYKKVNERKDVRWNTQKVNSEVMQGILQGESMPKIASRLKNVLGMNEVSAIRNARTCVTSAENGGRMDGINRLNAMGVPTKKQWLATKDSRTRHSHHDVDGEIVGPDDKFSNGLRYPGDPNGAASEVYNCRCTLLSIIDMEALGKQNNSSEKQQNVANNGLISSQSDGIIEKDGEFELDKYSMPVSKIKDFLLKPGSKHYKEFSDVGYTPADVERLNYDIYRNYDEAKAYDDQLLMDGTERFSINMNLGIKKVKPFRTVWQKDTPGSKPRFITAHREDE